MLLLLLPLCITTNLPFIMWKIIITFLIVNLKFNEIFYCQCLLKLRTHVDIAFCSHQLSNLVFIFTEIDRLTSKTKVNYWLIVSATLYSLSFKNTSFTPPPKSLTIDSHYFVLIAFTTSFLKIFYFVFNDKYIPKEDSYIEIKICTFFT